MLETDVIEVDENHKGSVHNPRRVLWGTVTATIVYALCGFAGAYGAWSVIIWAAVGAVGGWIFFYYYIRHATSSELARIGAGLPAQSSALAMWMGADDAHRVLQATATEKPSIASVASIGADLTTQVLTEPTEAGGSPQPSVDGLRNEDTTMLSLVVLRYPSPEGAKQMALQPPADSPLEVVGTIETRSDGHHHVSDPYFGVKALAKSEMIWWGGFGLVVGALSGAAGGGGIVGSKESAIVTAIVWGLAGLVVGAIYGLVLNRSFTSSRIRSLGSLVAPGSSLLMAWVDAASPLTDSTLDEYMKPGSERLVLNINAAEHGAVLQAVSTSRAFPMSKGEV